MFSFLRVEKVLAIAVTVCPVTTMKSVAGVEALCQQVEREEGTPTVRAEDIPDRDHPWLSVRAREESICLSPVPGSCSVTQVARFSGSALKGGAG